MQKSKYICRKIENIRKYKSQSAAFQNNIYNANK